MYKVIKRILDVVISFLGMICLFIPVLFIALAIHIDSKGPVIFKQERIGKDQKLFGIYKFRTMKSINIPFDPDNPVVPDNSVNLTKVGRIIRKYKLDELLQLINVFRGEMSLIGPRPFLPSYLERFDVWEKERFRVKPGMSGLSQIRGNGHLTTPERSYYDVIYARTYSFRKDLEIFFKTIGVVLLGEQRYVKHVPQYKLDFVIRKTIIIPIDSFTRMTKSVTKQSFFNKKNSNNNASDKKF